MKTSNIVGLAALALAAYLLYRNQGAPKAEKPKADGEKTPDQQSASMAGYSYATGDSRVTVEDLSFRPGLQTRWSLRVPYRRRRPETKQPIYINPTNAIPNVYDRGVGAQVVGMNRLVRDSYMNADGTQMYSTFRGSCSEDLQRACRCVATKSERYKLDVPQLP